MSMRIGLVFLGLAACAGVEEEGDPVDEGPVPCTPWSDPASWDDGVVPGVDACVEVAADRCVSLDVPEVQLALLHVAGTLRVPDNHDVVLSVDRVVVDGLLEIGTESLPFVHDARIDLTADRTTPTLTGEDAPGDEVQWLWTAECADGPALDFPDVAPRTLLVRPGGSLDLHGAFDGPAWVRLASTAGPDAADPHLLQLQSEVGWAPGDEIVLPSTGVDPAEAEVHVIERVEGRDVWTRAPLQHTHLGVQVRPEVDPAGVGVPMRGEVGSLTRNITVRGMDVVPRGLGGLCAVGIEDCDWLGCKAPPSPPEALTFEGAEIRAERGGREGPSPEVRLDGVGVRDAGKYGQLSHYPIHFHELEHAPDSYVRRSAVWRSANRAIVLHGTAEVVVEDNVVHDVVGHAYYIEPSTMGHRTHDNTLSGNLGSRVRGCNPLDASSAGPAVFYTRDLDNTMVDNVAAGSDYTGFYFDTRTGDPCTHTGDPTTCDASFARNTSHSSWNGLWADEVKYRDAEVVDFTVFKTRGRGVWLHNRGESLVTGLRTADVGLGVYFAFQSFRTVDAVGTLADSLLIGVTEHGPADVLLHDDQAVPRLGVELYEGRVQVRDTVFTDFPALLEDGRTAGAIGRNQNLFFYDNDPLNVTEGVTLVDANPVFFGPPEPDSGGTSTVAVFDLDGTLTGTSESWVVAPHAQFGAAEWSEPWGGLHLTRDRGELVQFVVDWVDPIVEAEGGLGQVEFMETEVLDPAGVVSSVIPGKLANAVRHKQAANVLTGGHYRVVYRDMTGSLVPGFDELRLILRSGTPGASVRIELPVLDPAWDGEVMRTTSFESNDDATPLAPAASADEVDADHYWFDPAGPSLTLAPAMLGSGVSPLDGELVILNVRR